MLSKFVGWSKSKGSPSKESKQKGLSSPEKGKYDRSLPERHAYKRPTFLQLSAQEEKAAGNHELRTIVTTTNNDVDCQQIPSNAGYAECINGGKSVRNEDQATCGKFVLPIQPAEGASNKLDREPFDVRYFCIFDGHAGTGAALMAADQLINHLQEKLMDVIEDLSRLIATKDTLSNGSCHSQGYYDVTVDSLVKGSIEAAFLSFDDRIASERKSYHIDGGCTAIMALVIFDHLYVANAGDCRAVGYIGDEIVQLSHEFTPETDAERIQLLAHLNPSLTHGVFNENCYQKGLGKNDIGKKVLFRAPMSSGWHSKVLTKEDFESPPLVAGRGKWARLMGVIGVTRGFGDHDLVVPATSLTVKPFMTAMPEILILDLSSRKFEEEDVVIMGSDGLWDFIRNEDMKITVKKSFERSRELNNNKVCYNDIAKGVVHFSRGDNNGRGWKMADRRDASFDDITAFAIPLVHLCKTSKSETVDKESSSKTQTPGADESSHSQQTVEQINNETE